MKKTIASLFGIFVSFFIVSATHAEVIPFNNTLWEIEAEDYRIHNYLGQRALWLKDGLALVKGSEDFKNGVIEFDIAIPNKRGFSGMVWRVEDNENYEEFYLRHHQSGNPDANQYSPVYNGLAAWQLYLSADNFGYPMKYKFDQWMHFKIVISDDEAEVYIEDMQTPIVYISDLRRQTIAGKVGLRGQAFAPAHYANFSLKKNQIPPLKRIAKKIIFPSKGPLKNWAMRAKKMRGVSGQPLQGLVTVWSVSSPFSQKLLDDVHNLPAEIQSGWVSMKTEKTGLLNLARIKGAADALKIKKNTVLTQIKVYSDMDQVKKIQFGFSDKIKVFLNDRIVFSADDSYRTRDYRFLGTVGFFDELYLNLKKGENIISFAVGENFGGWGIKARFTNVDNITFAK